ncbi:UNVERIFIED_CONTAM: hypothetical protein GTU68_054912, partial [Idotea baltica]|nr:hypothetical protein [Idotea baltica]
MNEMRAQQASMRSALNDRLNTADLTAEVGSSMSKKVIEAKNLSKTFDTPNGPLVIAEDLSVKILRGDRIGIIGPNGAGKTTLVKLLLGELEPDSGHLRHAKTLDVTYLDQTRDTLKPTDTLWEAMAPEGGDSIMVQGNQRHIAAYAKDFLFKPEQLRQPVGALSGGERNRLSLAIGLAKPANLMVLDEPTNDLDMQTLDLLEDMLLAFEGTLLLVSHDRAFLDSTVTSCLCPVGDGKWIQTAGGWSDAQDQLKGILGKSGDGAKAKVKTTEKSSSTAKPKKKLSFKEEHRQKELDDLILALPNEIAALEADLADPDLYSRDPAAFNAKSARIGAARAEM